MIYQNDLMVCGDCLQVIVNADPSSLDYYYDRKEAAKRLVEIENGINAREGHLCGGDPDRFEEFSTSPCDCCGHPLAGERHHVVELVEE